MTRHWQRIFPVIPSGLFLLTLWLHLSSPLHLRSESNRFHDYHDGGVVQIKSPWTWIQVVGTLIKIITWHVNSLENVDISRLAYMFVFRIDKDKKSQNNNMMMKQAGLSRTRPIVSKANSSKNLSCILSHYGFAVTSWTRRRSWGS